MKMWGLPGLLIPITKASPAAHVLSQDKFLFLHNMDSPISVTIDTHICEAQEEWWPSEWSLPTWLDPAPKIYTSSLGGHGPVICTVGCHPTAPASCLPMHPFASPSHFLHLQKRKSDAASVASFSETSDVAEMCLTDVGISVPSAVD